MTTTTRERPIIFSAPMIRAILAGRKTMTRRAIKPQPERQPVACAYVTSGWALEGLPNEHGVKGCSCIEVKCPYGVPGSRLYVKEAAYIAPPNFCDPIDANARDDQGRPRVIGYAASMDGEAVRCAEDYGVKKTSPIFLPRWASRITLEITEVRVERVQSISEADVRAKGIEWNEGPFRVGHTNHISAFKSSWDKLNGPRGFPWESNPWVWVLSFRRIEEGGMR